MGGSTTFTANANGIRYAGYFAWFIAALTGFVALRTSAQEFIAQHTWPVAPGVITSVEEKSHRNPGTSSTMYFARFWVEFDAPPGQCAPGSLVTTVGGPTRCLGVFDTLDGSEETASRRVQQHPASSNVSVLYQPHGVGLRFANQSIADVYPWVQIFTSLVIFLVGLALFLFARRQQQLTPSQAPSQSSPEDSSKQELIDLKLG